MWTSSLACHLDPRGSRPLKPFPSKPLPPEVDPFHSTEGASRRWRRGAEVGLDDSAMSRARISAPSSLRWKPSSARTSLPAPSRGRRRTRPTRRCRPRTAPTCRRTRRRAGWRAASLTASSWTSIAPSPRGCRRWGSRPRSPCARRREQVHHLAGPAGVLGHPLIAGRDRVAVEERPVSFGQTLGIVAAERDDDDVRVDRRQLLTHVRRPVEEVGAGQADDTL